MERSSSNKRNQVGFRNAITSSNSEAANLPASQKLPSGFRADLKNLAHLVQVENVGVALKHLRRSILSCVTEVYHIIKESGRSPNDK